MPLNTRFYNYCLDFVKGLACIFVVWMHCEFPGRTGVYIQAISRFCVPFFFMVSGYFLQKVSDPLFLTTESGKRVVNRKVRNIFNITFWATIFYLLWTVVRDSFWPGNGLGKSSTIPAWLVFNDTSAIGGHLWFLFALLYDYILVCLFDSRRIYKYRYVFCAASFVSLFVLGQGLHLAGIRIPNYYYRNWIVEGFAFFTLGRWIKENKDRINWSNTLLILIVAVSSLLCIVERRFMGRDFGVNICTLPQVFALFLYAVKNPQRHEGLVQRLGRDCSTMVYIIHIFVWQVFALIYNAVGMSDNLPALYLLPILVVIFSILLSLLFNRVVALFKKQPSAA